MIYLCKMAGQALLILICCGAWHFWHLKTSSFVPGEIIHIGGMPQYIPGKEVENLGRLNQRSDGLMLCGFAALVAGAKTPGITRPTTPPHARARRFSYT